MAQAMQDLSRWRELRPDLRMSVNFSGRHLSNPAWADEVHALAEGAGVPAANVDIELTETARPDNVTSGAEQLRRLQERGYLIWLDDFGTGWSELRHLVQLPVDGVKIDRFFAEALGGRADAVVRALTKAAEELGLGATIEGISQPEHATRAIALGCDIARGSSTRVRCPRRQPSSWCARRDRCSGQQPAEAVVQLLEVVGDLVGRHRPGDVETLHGLAVERAQGGQLLVVLDPLGDGDEPDGVGSLDHQVEQPAGHRRVDVEEPAVDLDDVDRDGGRGVRVRRSRCRSRRC